MDEVSAYQKIRQANCKHDKVTQFSREEIFYDVLLGCMVKKETCPECHKVLSFQMLPLH
jgi:hypothetical protein